MHEFPSVGRHLRQYLYPSIRTHETTSPKSPISDAHTTRQETYSANALSTTPTNLGPNPLATPTNSTAYVTLLLRPVAASERLSSLMPSASASRALRFLISHSPVQASTSLVPEQGIVERRCPQGQVSVTGKRQGSVSGQAAGAWHACVQGCCAGRLRGTERQRKRET